MMGKKHSDKIRKTVGAGVAPGGKESQNESKPHDLSLAAWTLSRRMQSVCV